MALEANKNIYASCAHIKRVKPDARVTEGRLKLNHIKNFVIYINSKDFDVGKKTSVLRKTEIAKDIGQNYRTLPTFEKGLFDYIYMDHYSLERNELLKCRWLKYKKHIEERVFAPFQFPCIRDLHFYNGCIRFLPAESIYRYPEHRMKLKPGPGVDFRGQMPIPQELLMKRGRIEKENDSKLTKNKKTHKNKD